jgi:protein involved in polysaccharide export with SLBB domain
MTKRLISIFLHFILLAVFMFSSAYAMCQPPPGSGSTTIPNTVPVVPPKNMTNAQLQDMGDKNDPGRDLNASSKKGLTKDSLTDESTRIPITAKSTYGSNVFSTAANADLSELSTPPLDYPIGVGDQIIVSLYGGADLQQSYEVASDGSIFPKDLGKIYVGGLMFDNMRKIVWQRFSDRTPIGTNIAISLGRPRTININVINEVNNPGIYTVSAFANAFTVIAKAGGVTDNGNLRNIKIKRNGRVIEELDVYEYLQTGVTGRKQYLQNNDFIIVSFYDKKVLATGQFKRPMYYQLKKDEGVKALLKYSGGLKAEALASNLQVFGNKSESQQVRNINANAILKFSNQDEILKDGDVVKANLIKSGITNKVEIKGEIKYPDFYEYREGDRLFDIINRAGGITKNTYLQRAYIFRGAGDTTKLTTDKLTVDLSDINTNNIESDNNVLLLPNDLVLLFNTSEFTDRVYVEIFGEVRKTGRVNKYGGMTLQDLIYLSGGLKQSAEYGKLQISSIVDIDSAKQGLKPTRTTVVDYQISSNLTLDTNAVKITLKPYDQIFVRKNPTFELQQNVEIVGLVKYPGLYPRLNKYEKLSSYIQRAGGFKENADLGGAVLYRRKTEFLREKNVIENGGSGDSTISTIAEEPVSIDLAKALKNKNSKYDIILQESDKIFIPEINPFVSIKGIVQSPLRIAFDKEHTSVRYYVDKAGGFGVRPWRRRISVKYANGRSRSTKNFLFFHFYPRVEEGCVVTVPIRPDGADITDVAKTTLSSLVPIILSAIVLKYVKF